MYHTKIYRRFLPVLLCFGLFLPQIAASQTKTGIVLELNRLTSQADACRISLVVTNGLEQPLRAVVLEVVLFDRQQIIERFMRLSLPQIGAHGMRAFQFDIEGKDCAGFGRILLNEVVSCEGVTLGECRAALRLVNRTDVEFLSSAQAVLRGEGQK